jgi:D-3-phosphoglycerate dehydrogenase
MTLRVLVSAPYMIPVVERFGTELAPLGVHLEAVPVEERLEEADLLRLVGAVDGVICGDDRFTERVFAAAAPRLKVVAKWGTGIDSIDTAAARKYGVRVCNTLNAFTQPVADSVLGYILAFARQIPWATASMRSGAWEKLPSVSLFEKTLGIVGIGNTGSAVAHRARAFSMRILGTDVRPIDPAVIEEHRIEMVTLDVLLRESDFVSLNCDLNPTSLHLISRPQLATMRPTAILINAARGPLVDQPALIETLEARRLAGAALDVFEQEPLPVDSPLRRMDNVLLAAHNANSSPTAWEAVHHNTIRSLLEGLGVRAGAART